MYLIIYAIILVHLENIQYIQRGGGLLGARSARNYNKELEDRQNNKGSHPDPLHRQLKIYYCTERPRSDYLYKNVTFQLMKTGKKIFIK